MNHKNIHDSIIDRASVRIRDPNVKYEYHHIIPLCEAGSPDGRCVYLIKKEHTVIHKLRYKMTNVIGNLLAYRLMKYGRSTLQNNHRAFSALGGVATHKKRKAYDYDVYINNQRQYGILGGLKSRDNNLGFYRLTEEQKTAACNRGRVATVSKKLGMFSDEYREQHRVLLQKRIHTPAGIFESATLATEFYKVTRGIITYRVKQKWEGWFYE